MATSHMNNSSHEVIINAILEVSKDDFIRAVPIGEDRTISSIPRGFKHSLECILSDFQDQITVEASHLDGASVRSPREESPSRVGRQPETLLRNSRDVWIQQRDRHGDALLDAIRDGAVRAASAREHFRRLGCWWCGCNQLTWRFIDKLFIGTDRQEREYLDEITWGTLLRYIQFINKNSEGWILSTVEGECSWDDHRWNVSNTFIHLQLEVPELRGLPEYNTNVQHPVIARGLSVQSSWTQKFNEQENEESNQLSEHMARVLGYLIPIPQPDAVVETSVAKKKIQLTEILIILEENATRSDISEGDYKEYADLLQSIYRELM
jgi:hypothetical protein